MGDLKTPPASRKAPAASRELPPVSRVHLDVMSNDIGVWQHAIGSNPNPEFGYCTDDVARALVVDVLHARQLGWAQVAHSVDRSVRFLEDAFLPDSGRFRNFRGAAGDWLDSGGSEDSHARAMTGLATVAAEAGDPDLVERATRLFGGALPGARSLTRLRPISGAILACDTAIGGGVSGEADAVLPGLVAKLAAAFGPVASDRHWPWPVDIVTYENAILPLGLLAAGRRTGDVRLVEAGCAVLDWLLDEQTSADGSFLPIGNGWWPRDGARSRFDQQPIEATTTLLAAEAAYAATGNDRYREAARMAFTWFLGDNLLGVRLADPSSGGCFDALTPTGVNANQGAESTLMWLTALEHMRNLSSPR
jgi:hypothetical protein